MTGKRFARLATAVSVCLLVLAAFVVQLLGGRGSVPGWQQLRAALGVPLQTEESAPQTADGSTVVYVLDVGQGDAVLLCQDGAYCLIDTGPVEAEDALLYDLDVLGVPSLDYLVLTHPHADHTGNARAVLRTLPVKTLLLPLWRRLLAITVHEELARVEGLPVAGLRLALMLLIAVVIAVAMKIVGVLLITSLLIIPAAAAQRHARTPEQMAIGASLLGMLAVAAGLSLSWFQDTPAGPSIVVSAAAIFLAGFALPRRAR